VAENLREPRLLWFCNGARAVELAAAHEGRGQQVTGGRGWCWAAGRILGLLVILLRGNLGSVLGCDD
jgi:hypothetical protein